MQDMEDLILTKQNSMEENILAIINFVKKVEAKNGLSKDQIVYKYTCGLCEDLAYNIIYTTLRKLFGNVKGLGCICLYPNCEQINYHWLVKLDKPYFKKELYFDITGKKTKKEIEEYLKSDFWDCQYTQPWLKSFNNKYTSFATDYVKAECKKHIKLQAYTLKISYVNHK